MRANATRTEVELQKFWHERHIYEKLSTNNAGEVFVLHDGPPYANGSLHIGHALNKTLKDIINKYKLLCGYRVRYVPGWDCHGLPIELQVLKNLSAQERAGLSVIDLRQKARDFALATVDLQRNSFKRYGVWGEWENPYLTMSPEYEAEQIGIFGEMIFKGYIYRGLKPVHWSPSSQTALAEAELEYPEGHTSASIYVAFGITQTSHEKLKPYLGDLAAAIWTTTPWTLPGNLAIAVNPQLSYALVEDSKSISKYRYLIVATDLVEPLAEMLETNLTIKARLMGSELEYTVYQHPLYERESPILLGGDYITTESGTGLVHTAPGHGQEDYLVGQRYGLPILSPVDDKGNLTAEAGSFAGLNVLNDANAAIIESLTKSKSLLKQKDYIHKYPYDWRTKKPTIFRATEQWFASVEGFREDALKAIKQVKWIPSQGENRITPMVRERSDWCISRQRSWGLPIPVFFDKETNEPLITRETIEHIQGIFAKDGSDAWYSMPIEDLLPSQYRQDAHKYQKGTDTMDVWFDSGSSWAAVAKKRKNLKYPVDMYLEGSDQHRGWFQSSLLTSVATNGIAPYQTVLTHGFVQDEHGRKMSKSVGNVVDPNIVIEGGKNKEKDPPYGVDILRLWVSSVDYSGDVCIGPGILGQIADIYKKIRNTARFLLGNLHDFDPLVDAVAYESLPELDQYMLHRSREIFEEVTTAYETYEFSRFFQAIQTLCTVDLSNFYLDIAKDRLYISKATSWRRRTCQSVLAIILENLSRAIAPVIPHLAEDIWQYLPYPTSYISVFESGWLKLEQKWNRPDLVEKWERLRELRTEVNKVMEEARKSKMIGSSLEAKVLIMVEDQDYKKMLASLNLTDSLQGNQVDELRYLFLSSQVELLESGEAIESAIYKNDRIAVVKSHGEKCERCWNYSQTVGLLASDPTLCDRCYDAIIV